jgi:hypothetical protein
MPRKKKPSEPKQVLWLIEYASGAGPGQERCPDEPTALKLYAELRLAGHDPHLYRAVEIPVELVAQIKRE